MLIETAPRSLTTSEIEVTGTYGIRAEDAPHIMRIIRDTMYSDTILAVVREYGTNAWDAHRDAGVSHLPIKVTLPSALFPFFSIRDWGKGLSETDVIVLYTQYGASTKRGSNDAVGGLGIGNKSGFAYSTSFTVTSWFGGKQSCYSAVLDEEDVGKMCKLAEQDCDPSETGLEITIPVKVGDFYEFRTIAKQVFQFFEPLPEGIPQSIPPVRVNEHLSVIRQSCSYVRMGCVTYPLPLDLSKKISHYHNFLFDMPIGSVPVAANRESLKLSDKLVVDLTRRIQKVLTETFEQEKARLCHVSKTFDTWHSIYRLKSIYRAIRQLEGGSSHRDYDKEFVASYYPTWDDVTLHQHQFRVAYRPKRVSFAGGLHQYIAEYDRIVLLGNGVAASMSPGRDLELRSTKDIVNSRSRLDKMLLAAGLVGIPIEVRGELVNPPRKKQVGPRPPKKPKKPLALMCYMYNHATGVADTTVLDAIPPQEELSKYIYMSKKHKVDIWQMYGSLSFLFGGDIELPYVICASSEKEIKLLQDAEIMPLETWANAFDKKVDPSQYEALIQRTAQYLFQNIFRSSSVTDTFKGYRWNKYENHPLASDALKLFGDLNFPHHANRRYDNNVYMSYVHDWTNISLQVECRFESRASQCLEVTPHWLDAQVSCRLEAFLKAFISYYFKPVARSLRGNDWLQCLVQTSNTCHSRDVAWCHHVMNLKDELALRDNAGEGGV